MATQVQITIDLTGTPYTFTGTSFTGDLVINNNPSFPVIANDVSFSPVNGATIVTSGFVALTPPLAPGSYTLLFNTNSIIGVTNPPAVQGSTLGTVKLLFGPGGEMSTSANLTVVNNGNNAFSGNIFITILCLHGSSLISMRDRFKRLDQIKIDDEILSGPNLDEYTKVKGVAQCWLTFMGVDHDAIIFEPGSLNSELNEPSQRLIIDPGHPICSRTDYLEKGYEALRPAGSFWEELKGETIYTKKWTDIFVQNEPSVRYDLILEEPFNTYVANGMVVRARGYKDHRYKQFV